MHDVGIIKRIRILMRSSRFIYLFFFFVFSLCWLGSFIVIWSAMTWFQSATTTIVIITAHCLKTLININRHIYTQRVRWCVFILKELLFHFCYQWRAKSHLTNLAICWTNSKGEMFCHCQMCMIIVCIVNGAPFLSNQISIGRDLHTSYQIQFQNNNTKAIKLCHIW